MDDGRFLQTPKPPFQAKPLRYSSIPPGVGFSGIGRILLIFALVFKFLVSVYINNIGKVILMATRFLLLIQYLIVFLLCRECVFPIKIRQWCRNNIGVFPLRINPGGFLCFNSDSFDLQHHRDHDHDFNFSTSIKDFQTQIWDPGDLNYKIKGGGISKSCIRKSYIWKSKLCTSHIYGSHVMLVSEIGISFMPCSKRLIILCIGAMILFPLLFISFSIKETLLQVKTRNNDIGFDDVIALPQSNQFVAPVFVYIVYVMELWLHQFGLCWMDMLRFYVVLIKYWRQNLISIEQIWWMRDASAMFRWEPINTRGSGIWQVQKFWCHRVYISELVLGTSGLMLRFVKKSFSHKLLHTNRNKEKSNMKLDNN